MEKDELIIKEFNKALFTLLTFIKQYDPAGPADRVINIARLAKMASYSILIEELGPMLIKYEEIIESRDHNSFLESDMIMQEIQRGYKKAGITSQKQLAVEFLVTIKTVAAKIDDDGVRQIYDKLDDLLLQYYNYLSYLKNSKV